MFLIKSGFAMAVTVTVKVFQNKFFLSMVNLTFGLMFYFHFRDEIISRKRQDIISDDLNIKLFFFGMY